MTAPSSIDAARFLHDNQQAAARRKTCDNRS